MSEEAHAARGAQAAGAAHAAGAAGAAHAAQWLPWLERAARLAMRGHGRAEPNPMVGCVVLDAQGAVAGEGYHARCGGPHAEVEALQRAGARARGGTAVVTLEPCNHTGRTGPCSVALMKAGVARVVYACTDPAVPAAGGAEALRAAGVEVLQVPCEAAERVTAPFLHRVRTGLPWVTAKWAQSADGLLVAPPGRDRWISGPRSRAKVHGERGRVDVVLTGMGTVVADDPLLTARCQRPLRQPLRVVWDPRLELLLGAQLVRTAKDWPVVAACLPGADYARSAHAAPRCGRLV
ncbi:MAG: bifunctional diaminohydroxyphosphoribosylaminopyrimidine deaminase/5-amino-6-(5-phosphoribosylamino)uracil reductase RibD [Phycisphaerales bacterium]